MMKRVFLGVFLSCGFLFFAPTAFAAVNCPEIPAENEVLLYTEENFQGGCTSYVGFSREIKRYKPSTGGDSRIRSLKVGSGIMVTICARSRFKGRCRAETNATIPVFDPDKKRELWRSVRLSKRPPVYKPGPPKPCVGLNKPNPGVAATAEQVTIFTEPNYRGSCKTIEYKGRDQKPWPYSVPWNYENKEKFWNNGDLRKRRSTINSMMIGSGVEVTVCTGKNFRGTCKKFTNSVIDLTGEGFGFNSVNSFKIYTLNPKKWVGDAAITDDQVRICKSRQAGGGCRKLNIGVYSFRGLEYRHIHVGANLKVQAYSEPFQKGEFEVYTSGTKQATPTAMRSIRVMKSEDELVRQETVAETPDTEADIPPVETEGNEFPEESESNVDEPIQPDTSSGSSRPTRTYKLCAQERAVCRTRGEGIVRYGANGQYKYKAFRTTQRSDGTFTVSSIKCDNATFGDPIPGVKKKCHRLSSDLSPPNADFELCARGGERCSINGSVEIAYGVNGKFVYRTINTGKLSSGGYRNSSVLCNPRTFGRDPVEGWYKRCYTKTTRHSVPNASYKMRAVEGGDIKFSGGIKVAYGVNGKFVYKSFRSAKTGTDTFASRTIKCDSATFGDPAKGFKKRCYVASINVPGTTVGTINARNVRIVRYEGGRKFQFRNGYWADYTSSNTESYRLTETSRSTWVITLRKRDGTRVELDLKAKVIRINGKVAYKITSVWGR